MSDRPDDLLARYRSVETARLAARAELERLEADKARLAGGLRDVFGYADASRVRDLTGLNWTLTVDDDHAVLEVCGERPTISSWRRIGNNLAAQARGNGDILLLTWSRLQPTPEKE